MGMTTDFHKIWIEQCAAARRLKEEFGAEKALGYMVGEKLVDFVRKADQSPEWARELPNFLAEITQIFERREIRLYLETTRRVGTVGHVCSDEEVEVLRSAGAIDDDPVHEAKDLLVVERIKKLLLAE